MAYAIFMTLVIISSYATDFKITLDFNHYKEGYFEMFLIPFTLLIMLIGCVAYFHNRKIRRGD